MEQRSCGAAGQFDVDGGVTIIEVFVLTNTGATRGVHKSNKKNISRVASPEPEALQTRHGSGVVCRWGTPDQGSADREGGREFRGNR